MVLYIIDGNGPILNGGLVVRVGRMNLSQPGVQRREVYFSGRVQGVGFRYTVRRIAGRYRVVGFVRNLANGAVQLVVEGPSDQLDQMIQDVDRAMAGYIVDKQATTSPATQEFDDFEIRF